MNTATKALLFAAPIMAGPSPTKYSMSAGRFPKFETVIDLTKAYDTLADKDQLKTGFEKNKAGNVSGIYQGYRSDGVYVAPTQQLGETTGTVASKIIAMSAGRTFYENVFANGGKVVKPTIDFADANAIKLKKADLFGAVMNMCVTANNGAAVANVATNCWGVAQTYGGKTNNSGTADRLLFDNLGGTSQVEYTVATTAVAKLKTSVVNTDLIMGALFSAVGKTGDKAWCSGKFYNEVASADAKASVNGQAGFGPRGKCTWQIVSAVKTHGPIIQLDVTPQVDALLQVIEWYDTAYLGSTGLIDAAKAILGKSFIGKDKDSYAIANGVFLNPITKAEDTDTMPNSDNQWSASQKQDSTLINPVNSVGTVAYYSRDADHSSLVYGIDSTAVTNAYGVYNSIKTAYESALATYNTDKTAYETAVEDNKKDPKKTVPTRPNMPSATAAYAGPNLRLKGQLETKITDTWAEIAKLKGPMDGLLATGMTDGMYTYDVAELGKSFHNRVNYVVMSAANDATKTAGVGVTFGRLGQGKTTMIADGSPFAWGASTATTKPGMQLSIFPEYKDKDMADWAVDATKGPTFSYKTTAFASLDAFDAPSAPTAGVAIKDSGAINMAAASMVAVAAIAATMC